MNRQRAQGFIALMSAIIISAVLLLVVTTSSFIGFYTRFNMLDAELKARSSAAASACADTQLLKAAQRDLTSTALTLNAIDVCQAVVLAGNTIKVQATSSNSAVTNLLITYTSTDYSITSWQEIPIF